MTIGADDINIPNLSSVIGGGASASILWGAWWLINRYRTVAEDGEALAERRITSLNDDFTRYRERADGEIGQLRIRLDEYRTTNDTLRTELWVRDQTIMDLRQRVVTLEAAIRDLRGQPPPGMDPPPGGLPHGVG